ncbi:hypothetical protein GCM10027176_45370 [Actinoallomurus bryophytorum]|uniref:Uncharacterized protein n=1 Tax=Actinoallomurus bryophytorum TaxID=1490222 RepID=A0A543CCJ4_9ACTN|nr:hypothetical protein FB559_0294 [Actinoallomurus bryophytorum]
MLSPCGAALDGADWVAPSWMAPLRGCTTRVIHRTPLYFRPPLFPLDNKSGMAPPGRVGSRWVGSRWVGSTTVGSTTGQAQTEDFETALRTRSKTVGRMAFAVNGVRAARREAEGERSAGAASSGCRVAGQDRYALVRKMTQVEALRSPGADAVRTGVGGPV